MKQLFVLLIFALATLGLVPHARGAGEMIIGRVYDASTKAGIAALTVRLRPPKTSTEAEKLESTDGEGKFRFTELKGDRYLLEVFQGPRVLYRKEVVLPRDKKVEIPLRKR